MSIHKFGTDIIALLYALVKAVQVYDLNNAVVQTAAKKIVYSLKTLLNIYSRVQLVRYMDYVFFNKQRLRFEIDGYASLQFIHDKLKTLGIKSLSFLPGIDKEEMIIFASLFKKKKEEFTNGYSSSGFKRILIEFSTEEDDAPDFLREGERIKKTYFKALKVTRNLMQNLWMNQPIDVKSSRRIIYNLIDSLTQDEFGLLTLTAIKNLDDYTYNHSLNVGILALALGQRIGLSKKSLAKLGSAGILHDIGKVALPKELIYKSERLTNEEWELLKKHSDYGIKEIVKARGLDETGLISMTIAYQHHWNYNGSGYPIHNKNESPILFSRIVRICDSYDAMTTPRMYQVVPYLPHFALRVMWKLRNVWFDPLLTKVFIQLLGLYPIGSCLELDNGEIALVIRQNQGYSEQPIVKIILDKDGKKVAGKVIDLSMNSGIKVIKPIYAQKYGINPATYFM